MPLYEYECLSCGNRTEVLQRYEDPPLAACPECGGPMKKLASGPSFHFKGSGWYATDYAGKKGKAGPSTDKPDGAKPAETSASADSSSAKDSKSKEGTAPATPPKSAASS